jgi:hypothetical protein
VTERKEMEMGLQQQQQQQKEARKKKCTADTMEYLGLVEDTSTHEPKHAKEWLDRADRFIKNVEKVTLWQAIHVARVSLTLMNEKTATREQIIWRCIDLM